MASNFYEHLYSRRAFLSVSGAVSLYTAYRLRHQLKGYLFDLAFAAPCSQTNVTAETFINEHPELQRVYKTIDEKIIPYYSTFTSWPQGTAAAAFDGIFYREVYDFGYSPFCISPLTEAQVKASINSTFRAN